MKRSKFSETQIVAVLKEAENTKLKRMYADLALENEAIKAVLQRKL
jgi:hypothetical protein